MVYLTFDDGPSKRTLEILDILYEYEVEATFFVTGNNLSGDKNIYSRIVEEGHALGNHTYTHRINEIYKSAEAFMEDFDRLEELLIKEAKIITNIMRFPGGSSIKAAEKIAGHDVIGEIIKLLKEKGYDYFDWNIDSKDTALKLTGKEIFNIVKNEAKALEKDSESDLVILLHDTPDKYTSVDALPKIIEYFSEKGYTFQSLSKGNPDIKHR